MFNYVSLPPFFNVNECENFVVNGATFACGGHVSRPNEADTRVLCVKRRPGHRPTAFVLSTFHAGSRLVRNVSPTFSPQARKS
jgi:hypothetical protein